MPDASLDVCEAFVARCAKEARDIRTARSGDEHTVGKLVFSAYAQLKDQKAQERALALIDEMILEGLQSASGHLANLDR